MGVVKEIVKKALHPAVLLRMMAALFNVTAPMTQLSRSLKVLLAVAALTAASGCETLNSLNPFGGSDEDVGPSVKKHDDRPITQKTGEIPADRANSSYSDEDLKAEPQQ